jgi:hypothetical protein
MSYLPSNWITRVCAGCPGHPTWLWHPRNVYLTEIWRCRRVGRPQCTQIDPMHMELIQRRQVLCWLAIASVVPSILTRSVGGFKRSVPFDRSFERDPTSASSGAGLGQGLNLGPAMSGSVWRLTWGARHPTSSRLG